VTEFGINPDNVFQCGIGLAVVFIMECRWLTISLAIGFDNFDELLVVQMKWMIILNNDFDQNMPVVLAL
jgi:hypothetical protein